MKELTEDQKHNAAIFNQIKDLLDQAINTSDEHNADAHIFITVTTGDKVDGLLTCVLGGKTVGFTQALMQVGSNDKSGSFKRAMVIAVANLLVMQPDEDTKLMGSALGMWYEGVYGAILCECHKCVAQRKAKIKNDINLN